jgi:hypothetical protein
MRGSKLVRSFTDTNQNVSDRVFLHNPQPKPPLYPVHGVGEFLRVQHRDYLGDRFTVHETVRDDLHDFEQPLTMIPM